MIKGLKGPIALGTIRTSLVLGLRLVIQAGTLLLVLSTLGSRGFGTYAGLGSMAVLLGTLANFGTHLTLLRDISRDSIDMGEGLRRAPKHTLAGFLFLVFINEWIQQAFLYDRAANQPIA